MESDHNALFGDCLDILKKIPSNYVDLVFTDPPYNQNIKYIKKDFIDRKKPDEYLDWLKDRMAEVIRVLKPNGTLYLMNYPEWNARILPFLEEQGLFLKRWMVWHYPTNIGHSKKNWTRSHRSILFLTKDKDNYTFNKHQTLQPYKNPDVGKIKDRIREGHIGRGAYDVLDMTDVSEMLEMQNGLTDVIRKNLLKNVRSERKTWHNCQLPPELIDIFIRTSSNPGDVVLDPFAGTFTTSMVAKKLGRKSIGIDISKQYVRLGVSRLREIDGKV